MAFKFPPCWWKARPEHCQSPCGEWIFMTPFSSFSLIPIICSTEWVRVLREDRMCDIQCFSLKGSLGVNHKPDSWSESLLFRLDVPSLRASFTSSSWPLSPGCVWRGSSCTSCSSRSSRANTHGKSTTTCRVTSSRPSWSASPPPSTTAATGPGKRKCDFSWQILGNAEQTRWMFPLCGFSCCACMWQRLKRKLLIICASALCASLETTPKHLSSLCQGWAAIQFFMSFESGRRTQRCGFRGGGGGGGGGLSYINAFLLKDPPVTSCL